jgi:hypothetical protein
VLWSPEIKRLAARPPSERAEGPCLDAAMAWPPGPAGVQEQGERPGGFPSNRRDLLHSLVLLSAPGVPNRKPPGPSGQRLGPAGAKTRRTEGIAGRAQESGETGWQGSEPFVVPWKPGNSSREDPAEGRGGRVTGPRPGTKARTPSLSTLSTKRPRIAQRGSEAVT